LLETLVQELELENPLAVADLDGAGSVNGPHLAADVVVVDLGVDASLVDRSTTEPVEDAPLDFPTRLDGVFAALEHLIAVERSRLARGEQPRRIVVVNSATAFWDDYVLTHLDCSHTSAHSRVRRATVKPAPDERYAATADLDFARRQVHWGSRRRAGDGRLRVSADVAIEIAELEDYSGFGEGWAYPDGAGIWTEGRRAELDIALDGDEEDAVLALEVDGVCAEPEGVIRVEVSVDGERLTMREFSHPRRVVVPSFRRELPPGVIRIAKRVLPDAVLDRLYPLYWRLTTPAALRRGVLGLQDVAWRIQLPDHVVMREHAHLTFVVDEPRTPLALGWGNDERELGVHLRALTLESRAPRFAGRLARNDRASTAK
jgi:hypothetical protein